MELIENKYRIRCEMGACKNLAKKTIKMSRVGIRSRIHICDDCLRELYELIGANMIPKSIETAKKVIQKPKKSDITGGEGA